MDAAEGGLPHKGLAVCLHSHAVEETQFPLSRLSLSAMHVVQLPFNWG